MDRETNALTPENMPRLEELIDKIYNRKDAAEFRFPVDYVGLGILFNYRFN